MNVSLNICHVLHKLGASLVALLVRICPQFKRPRFNPWVKKILWKRKWQPTPVFLPGKSDGQRSLVHYSPRGPKGIEHDFSTKQPQFCSVQLSRSVVSYSLQPHEPQHARPPCPSPTPGIYRLMSIESVMPSNHLILCHPLLLLTSTFPSIRVFSNESALRMRWPKYWSFSFNISPSNEHPELISLEWTGWISLQSKGLSRVFSNTTVQKDQFFSAQLSL